MSYTISFRGEVTYKGKPTSVDFDYLSCYGLLALIKGGPNHIVKAYEIDEEDKPLHWDSEEGEPTQIIEVKKDDILSIYPYVCY